ncbi:MULTISPECIES: PA14 domain-containing protein [Bhargavaea]|uniref:PA14 domain-containing protein n=1 Tax=Bhargavaea changchunensis TaxID=2134037 RepID=A0ABW2NC82_9BACL|nr:PA14 domain-containing protein [Bhargavaea sp. CC-171006]
MKNVILFSLVCLGVWLTSSLSVNAAEQITWQAKYFNNTSFQGVPSKHEIEKINFDWGGGSPNSEINTNNFSAEFSSTIKSNGGVYKFEGEVDDAIDILVNGESIFKKTGAGSRKFTAYTDFKNGDNFIEVRYVEYTGSAKIKVSIEKVKGWSIKYYNNLEQIGTPIYDENHRIKYNWKSGSPIKGINANNFSAVFEKEMDFSESTYRLAGQFDDAITVYIDGKKIYDFQKGGRDYVNKTFEVKPGKRKVKVIYKEYTGAASLYIHFIPASKWGFEFYNNLNRSGFPALSTSEKLDFNWGSGSPGTAVVNNNFTAKIYKTFDSKGGFYKIHGNVDDLIEVKINGKTAISINKAGNHSFEKILQLPKGDIEVELAYTEYTGGAKLVFDLLPVDEWLGAYYSNTSFKGLPKYLTHTDLNQNFGKGGPKISGFPNDNFSAEYTKNINFKEAGFYEFYGESDDMLEINVGSQKIVDINDRGHHNYSEIVYIPAGNHKVTIRFVEYSGNALLSFNQREIDTSRKWIGEYYPNNDFKGPSIKKAYDNLNLNFGYGSPAPNIPVNNFSAIYKKNISIKKDGYYVLSGSSDDTVEISVSDKNLININKPGSHVFNEIVRLKEGIWPAEVVFEEYTGASKINLDIKPYGYSDKWVVEYYDDTNFSQSGRIYEVDNLSSAFIDKDFFNTNRSILISKEIEVKSGIYQFDGKSIGELELYINGERIDYAKQGESLSTSVYLNKGKHKIELKYKTYNENPNINFTYTPKEAGEGWTSYFYNNNKFNGIPIVENTEAVEFDWGSGSPHKTIPNNYFSGIFERTFQTDEAVYHLTGLVDDKIRVLVNNVEVYKIDSPGSHRIDTYISLPKGLNVIKIYYEEITGAAKINIKWSQQNKEHYSHYNITINEMLESQLKLSPPPQTDKYRNLAPWVHHEQLTVNKDTLINSNGVALRTDPNNTSDSAIKAKVNQGTIIDVLEKGITGFTYKGSTEWYRIKYNNMSNLYVHSSLVEENAKTAKINVEVLSNSTNLRSKPFVESNNVITSLSKGNQLEYSEIVSGQSVSNSTKWYKVKYNGADAYLHTSVANVNAQYFQNGSFDSHLFGNLTTTDPLKIITEKNGWYQLAVYPVWRNAPKMDVEMAINPSNANNFEFVKLSRSLGVSGKELNQFLESKGTLTNQGDAFAEAGKKYSVNEIYLLSHSLLETNHGRSDLAQGVEVGIDTKSEAQLVTDSNRSKLKDIKVVYNMYGIEAYDKSPLESGAKKAYREGWTTPSIAIREGAKWIADRYIHHPTYKQDTLYKMRWNPENPGLHQYATDIGWAAKQIRSYQGYYDKLDKPDFVYDIPVYKK